MHPGRSGHRWSGAVKGTSVRALWLHGSPVPCNAKHYSFFDQGLFSAHTFYWSQDDPSLPPNSPACSLGEFGKTGTHLETHTFSQVTPNKLRLNLTFEETSPLCPSPSFSPLSAPFLRHLANCRVKLHWLVLTSCYGCRDKVGAVCDTVLAT